ncbi:MAG: beta-propeller domain-containing protein, partial [Cocleimonas sp.]|nr:beta-propeller domain-containing protein [Cocleimonas sp.]
MCIHTLKWLLPLIIIFSNSVYAEAIGDKEGYLKQVSSQQLDSQIHDYLIEKIKIENPQPYTDKEIHSHPAIWRCTKAVKHKHHGARNHSHTHNCPNIYRRERGLPMPVRRAPRAMAKRAAKPQASSTNVQEKGVDEADFVKTDGRYLFAISNNNYAQRAAGVRIFDTQSGSKQPRQISAIGFHKNMRVEGMYLMPHSHKLIIIGNSYRKPLRNKYSRWSGTTHVISVDIRNKAKPSVLKHVQMEGHSKTTRRIGNQLYLVLSGGRVSFPETYKVLETPKKMTEAEYRKVKQEMIAEIKKWSI